MHVVVGCKGGDLPVRVRQQRADLENVSVLQICSFLIPKRNVPWHADILQQTFLVSVSTSRILPTLRGVEDCTAEATPMCTTQNKLHLQRDSREASSMVDSAFATIRV
jgi:hypothetical protein